jgi:glycosyltransferase involved in cell wall biosynthesis
LFEKIDVLAVPSLWHEPFGRVAIEAMAWGIPVIASRRGGLPEIVQPGVNGWLFEPDEKESLPRFLRSLNPETCRAMRGACLERARAFLPEVITAQYEKLYQRVLLHRQSQLSGSEAKPASPSRVDSIPVGLTP